MRFDEYVPGSSEPHVGPSYVAVHEQAKAVALTFRQVAPFRQGALSQGDETGSRQGCIAVKRAQGGEGAKAFPPADPSQGKLPIGMKH